MERRDYLEVQIEQLGQVLRAIANLLGAKKTLGAEAVNQQASQALKEELGFDVDALTGVPDNDFIAHLANTGRFNNQNYEALATILVGIAQSATNDIISKNLYSKALLLYKHVDEADRTYSANRYQQILQIEGVLASL